MLPEPFIYYPFYPLVQWWFRVIGPPILPSLFFHLYLQLFLSFHLFPSIPSLHTMLLISIFSFRLRFFFSPILQSSIQPISSRPFIHFSRLAFTHSSTAPTLSPLCIRPFIHPLLILYLLTLLSSIHPYIHSSTDHLIALSLTYKIFI